MLLHIGAKTVSEKMVCMVRKFFRASDFPKKNKQALR